MPRVPKVEEAEVRGCCHQSMVMSHWLEGSTNDKWRQHKKTVTCTPQRVPCYSELQHSATQVLKSTISLYFRYFGSPSTGNPPPARAFFIASTVVFSESKVTVAVWFSASVETFETPLIPLRIVPTLAAVPAHLQPGTDKVAVFSAANTGCKPIRQNITNTSTDKNLFFPITSSLLSLESS